MKRKIILFIVLFTAMSITAQNDQEILKKQTDGTYYKLLNTKEISSFDLTLHELGMLSLTCSKCPHVLFLYLQKESEQLKRNCFFSNRYKMVLVNYDKDSFVTMSIDEKGEAIVNFITKDKNKLKTMTHEKAYAFAEKTVMKLDFE